jgi:hypothetical protein
MFHVADNLDSVRAEMVIVAGQLKTGTGYVRDADAALVDVSGIIDDLKVIGLDYLRKENARKRHLHNLQ